MQNISHLAQSRWEVRDNGEWKPWNDHKAELGEKYSAATGKFIMTGTADDPRSYEIDFVNMTRTCMQTKQVRPSLA